jgi:hypothetical protein
LIYFIQFHFFGKINETVYIGRIYSRSLF